MPAAARSPKQSAPRMAGGPAAPLVDISAGMPRTMRDDLTGDFLGRGYDQRMRAEGTNLNIYDSPSRGGTLLRSTPLDLAPAPDSGVYDAFGWRTSLYRYTWADYGQESPQSCLGCFQALWESYHLNTIYLARNNDNLFLTGTTGNTFDDGTPYRNLLYVLPPDGSRASAICARYQVILPNQYPADPDQGSGGIVRAIGVTSLAAGYVDGVPYLAVGLSDGGVQIYNVAGTPQLTSAFIGMATPDLSQTPPTTLAWDPSGSGLLAIGVISWANEGFFVQVNGNGIAQPDWLTWAHQGTDALVPSPLCAAFGQRLDGSPVVAFGMTDGTLQLVDPKATGPETNALAVSSAGPGAIVAVNPIPRLDGTVGGSDYAVSYQGSSVLAGTGGLLRWDGTSSGLTAQPVSAGSPDTVSPDWDSFRAWYPGIKEGRFQVSNTSGEPVTVALHASPSPGSGCWYAPGWADAPAFPAEGITVPAGQASPIYTMGAYTAGANGGCAATDLTGGWLGYLVVTPVSHPADTRLACLRLNRDMTVDVTEQAGGATTVSVTSAHNQLAAFGLWTITVSTPPAPAPQTPAVTGSRVTSADWPGPAVYRFDVTGAVYQLPADDQFGTQVMVAPLLVQGSVDGASWTSLGSLVPATGPTVTAGSADAPAQLTLGKATFWWENPPGAPAYQAIRVGLGPAGAPCSPVTLADLPAPAAEPGATGVSIASPTSDNVARPVASGVDQAPLLVQVLDANSSPLPASDPSYQRIFYRDGSGNLVTNLFATGADPAGFIAVGPYPGAYPNDGSLSKGPAVAGTYHYVSTTSTTDQHITGYAGGVLNAGVPAYSPVEVHAAAISPVAGAAPASEGISLAGCTDFTGSALCRLAPSTAPALFLDTAGGAQIGILTAVQAMTSVASLPLQQTAGAPEHRLAAAPLTVSGTAATLTDTSGFAPGDHVDTWLVTHGALVPATDIPASS